MRERLVRCSLHCALTSFASFLFAPLFNLPLSCRLDDESDVNIDRSSFTLKDMVEWGLHHPAAGEV